MGFSMDAINFILKNGEAWLQYATKVNILKESKERLTELKCQALNDPLIKEYLNDISNYHSILVKNHKDPNLPIYKLLFLLDIGFGNEITEIQEAINQILEHKDISGVYQSRTNIPKHFGGNGEDTFGWCLCDAPLLLLALLKAGVNYEEHIKQGVEYLISFFKDVGFPCTVSPEFGKFRGPGRKDDCCPNASLQMLKLLSAIDEYSQAEITINTAMEFLSLWENSWERHPYMYYMGTDFRKLKAPPVWYDLVSVTDALRHVKTVKSDERFIGMVELIRSKQDSDGIFTPESVYQKFKGLDFGQKKMPSPYLTYLCYKILDSVDS